MKQLATYLCFSMLLVACQQKNSESNQKTVQTMKASQTTMTAGEITQRIRENVTCAWSQETVDTYKTGSPSSKITGVAVTFLANLDVLQRAKEQGLNMVISHEPVFYNHLDETGQLEGDPVYQAKKKFIEDHGIVVWRFHDHWHRTQPDGIYEGMIDKLEWRQNLTDPEEMIFTLQEQSVGELMQHLQGIFGSNTMRLIGDPEASFTTVGFIAGAPGSAAQMALFRQEGVQVLIAGESREWETVEYARDAITAGQKKAMIILGHALSEEAGMEYCAEWLKDFVKEVPVKFVPAGDPFTVM